MGFDKCVMTFSHHYSIIRRRQWQPTPVLLPGKSHGRRSLVGCSPWGRKESDTTERLHFHFSLSCIGEGNGNPLHRSCLENPRDGGAWWTAVYGVAQSRTRLKWLSSSSRRNVQSTVSDFFHSASCVWGPFMLQRDVECSPFSCQGVFHVWTLICQLMGIQTASSLELL